MPLSRYPLPPVSDLRLTVLFEANDATGYFPVHEHGFRGHGLVVKDPLPVHHECVPAPGWEGGHPVRLRGQLVVKEYGEVTLRHVAQRDLARLRTGLVPGHAVLSRSSTHH